MRDSLPVTAPIAEWNYDMNACPKARKVLLLTIGQVAVIGEVYPGGFVAWSPLPKRRQTEDR